MQSNDMGEIQKKSCDAFIPGFYPYWTLKAVKRLSGRPGDVFRLQICMKEFENTKVNGYCRLKRLQGSNGMKSDFHSSLMQTSL